MEESFLFSCLVVGLDGEGFATGTPQHVSGIKQIYTGMEVPNKESN
jgi:hypothetical protein